MLKVQSRKRRGTPLVHGTSWRPRLMVTCDGRNVVSHAGSRLLADLAEVTGLTAGFGAALVGCGSAALLMIRAGC